MKKLIYSMLVIAVAAMALTSCEDVPAPYDTPTADDSETSSSAGVSTGDGSLENPFNSVAANEYAETLGSDVESDDWYYIKGRVVSISEEFSSDYGNATFYISDDGTSTDEFYVYRAYYLGNKKWTEDDPQIEEGDSVVVYAKIINYSGSTPETVQGSGYLYYHNGDTGSTETTGVASGSGTLDDPYNCTAAIEYASSLDADEESDEDIYIKGVISSISEEFTSTYGNATFYISDDGSTDSDEFYVYRAYYLGNRKWTSGDTQIKEGDEVIICGKVTNYSGSTPETVQNDAYIYSLNGVTEEESSTEAAEASGSGTLSDPYNCAAAIEYTSALDADEESDEEIYIKGIIASISEEYNSTYGNGTFYISDDGTTSNTFLVWRAYYLGNQKWVEGNNQIEVGDEVIICGKVVNYYGNTPETVQNEAYLYSLNGSTEDTGEEEEEEEESDGITTTDEYISFTCESLGLENGVALSTVTLPDGTTLTFASGGNSNSPTYYDNRTSIRMYPSNTMTISSSKTIASVSIECDVVSSVICNASENVTASPGTISFDDYYINVNAISSTSATITNTSTSTGTLSQIRMVSMTIYYAE